MVLHDEIVEVVNSRHLSEQSPSCHPFRVFNFTCSQQVVGEQHASYVLALCHAVWQHASIGQLSILPRLVIERVVLVISGHPAINQLLINCHLYLNQTLFYQLVTSMYRAKL